MKYAVIALVLVASTGTAAAVAQEGAGHGPPSSQTAPVVVPTSPTLPTLPSTGTPKTASAHVGTSLSETGPAISSARESRKRGSRLA